VPTSVSKARKAATEQAEVERQLWDKGATSSRSAAAARAERPGAQRLGMNDASGAVAIRPGIAGRIHDQMLVVQAGAEALVLIIRPPKIAWYNVGSLTG
jgi:hypothetical protein